MTARQQLAKLEAGLTPTQRVVRWLDEAHACGSLEGYLTPFLDGDLERFPLDRLADETIAGVRASLRGKRSEVVQQALRRALRETVVRFELVIGLNVSAHELLEREVLLDAALGAHIVLVSQMDDLDRRHDAGYVRRYARLRDGLRFRVQEIHAVEEARTNLEHRYLDGHPALFPDLVTAWAEQRTSSEGLADLACQLAGLDGIPAGAPADPDVLAERVKDLEDDWIEQARITALEQLGASDRARERVVARLRAQVDGAMGRRKRRGEQQDRRQP